MKRVVTHAAAHVSAYKLTGISEAVKLYLRRIPLIVEGVEINARTQHKHGPECAMGIAAAAHARIFDEFYNISSVCHTYYNQEGS